MLSDDGMPCGLHCTVPVEAVFAAAHTGPSLAAHASCTGATSCVYSQASTHSVTLVHVGTVLLALALPALALPVLVQLWFTTLHTSCAAQAARRGRHRRSHANQLLAALGTHAACAHATGRSALFVQSHTSATHTRAGHTSARCKSAGPGVHSAVINDSPAKDVCGAHPAASVGRQRADVLSVGEV